MAADLSRRVSVGSDGMTWRYRSESERRRRTATLVLALGLGAVAAGCADEGPDVDRSRTSVATSADTTPITFDAVPASTAASTTVGAPPPDATSTTPTTALGSVDLEVLAGVWYGPCEPYIPRDGASSNEFVIEVSGPRQLSVTSKAFEYDDADCQTGRSSVADFPFVVEVIDVVGDGATTTFQTTGLPGAERFVLTAAGLEVANGFVYTREPPYPLG
jgi:hypothetical protein